MWAFGALSAALAAGYGVLFTVVGDFRDAYGVSDTEVGLIIGIGFISAFFAQVFIAPIADRGYARRLVTIGVAVNVLGLLMMAWGETFGVITVGRIISGLGIGAATPAIRRIVVLLDPDNLGRNLGILLSADVTGFALGPAISAVLVEPFGLAAPFLVVAGLTTALWIATLRISVQETNEPERKRLALDLLRERRMAGAVALGAAVFLMIGAFDALWDVVHEDLGTPTWMANLGITLFAVPLVVLGPFSGRMSQRIGPFPVAAAGLLAGAAFLVAYGYLPTGEWIFGVAMGHALTDGLTIAASGVAVGMVAPAERQAGAQGVLGAMQSLVGGVTAIVVGGLYDEFGRSTAYVAAAVGMLLLVAAGMALGAPSWRRTPEQRRPRLARGLGT